MQGKGLVPFFFGICICQFKNDISIEEAHYAREIVASVLLTRIGPLVSNQSGVEHSIPLPTAGNEYKAALVSAERPFNLPGLTAGG